MAGKITSRQLAPSRPLGELTLASRRSLTLANLALVTESCNLVGVKASIKTVEVIPRPEQWEASWGIPVKRRPLYSKAYCFPACHCHSDSVAKAQPENETKETYFRAIDIKNHYKPFGQTSSSFCSQTCLLINQNSMLRLTFEKYCQIGIPYFREYFPPLNSFLP